jgi:hypothetical protein
MSEAIILNEVREIRKDLNEMKGVKEDLKILQEMFLNSEGYEEVDEGMELELDKRLKSNENISLEEFDNFLNS